MSTLLTKEQAMKKFGIDDLRKFNTGDFIKIMSSIDKMDPEVAKELIGQIPNFLSFVKESANMVKDAYDSTLKSDDESLKNVYASYDLLINTLNDSLSDGELSLDEKFEISKIVRDLIHDKQELHFKQQERRNEIFKTVVQGVGAVVVGVVAILSGTSMIKSKPKDVTHDDYS